MKNSLPLVILGLIWGGSLSASVFVSDLLINYLLLSKYLAYPFGFVSFVIIFALFAGFCSLLGASGIKRGIFPRDPLHPIYLRRRIYGLCWTQIYYFKPLYSIILSVPIFRLLVFRLFGYRGSSSIVVYPDTWIRDLPLLHLQEGAYLSNKATIGTNICLANGSIFVDKVAIGKKSLIGHLSMIAPGVTIEDEVEIGVGTAVGIRSRIKKRAKVNPTCAISHGVIVGENTEIGSHSHIGLRAELGNDLKIPAGSDIPSGAILFTQEDVNKHTSFQREKLSVFKEDVLQVLKNS